ncbi:Uncharacterised protein [Mycobacteroides abscessus subsp. massiliense]|nr:Uncharacterised protein [Mycobacteroides abscessus subsp. massiliense]
MTLKVPVRLTLTIFSNSASGNGPFLPTVLTALPMPAQFTVIRSEDSALARSTASVTAASSVTSAGANSTVSPRAASASVFAVGRSTAITRAPDLARAVTVASPRPEAPPVTSALVPVICMNTPDEIG